MAFPGYAAPTGFVVDAAVLLVGSTPMGASDGGITFNPGREVRHVEFDGKTSEIAGLHRVTAYGPTITGRFKDLSGAAILRYEPGSTSDGSSTNLFTMKPARDFWVTGDYLAAVKLKGNRTPVGGVTKALVVNFAYAYVQSYQIITLDKDEADVELTLIGVLAPGATDLELCPYTYAEEP